MNAQTQIDAAKRSLLVVRREDRSVLVVTGPDGPSWLNGLVTCDLGKRNDGDAAYGLVVARNGRILGDAFILYAGDRILLSVPSGAADALSAHFEHYLVMEQAELEIAPGYVCWEIHGPRAPVAVAAAVRAGGEGGVLNRTGAAGAFVVAPPERVEAVAAALRDAAAGEEGAIGDDSGWDLLRLELGVPEFGADFDDKTYPQEAGLEKRAVSFNKGCYLGQEVVCMLEMRGHVKRKLASLRIEAGEAPAKGTVVLDSSGAEVGQVTSAATDPIAGGSLALAMLKSAQTELGSRLLVGGAAAQVVAPAI